MPFFNLPKGIFYVLKLFCGVLSVSLPCHKIGTAMKLLKQQLYVIVFRSLRSTQ